MTNPGNNNLILIAEDDHNTASLVSAYLTREGFATRIVEDGQKALTLAESQNPVLIILDIMLPLVDGWEVCRQLRRKSNVPILMLTAREEEIDRVLGLSLGADDYVVKPFSPRELVERVKAILRRVNRPDENSQAPLIHGTLILDPEKHKLTVNNEIVNLTSSEFKILHALMKAPGRVFSRDELLNHFYERGEIVIDRVIDVHIGKIRQKIEDDASNPRYIITVRGFGYKFAD
jgi:DNA-binding response OmpR family regulator